MKCRKNAESKNLKVEIIKNGKKKKKLISNCSVCNSKQSGFFKDQEQEPSGLLSSLGIKRPFS